VSFAYHVAFLGRSSVWRFTGRLASANQPVKNGLKLGKAYGSSVLIRVVSVVLPSLFVVEE
jgi:hypothetical protein